MWGAHLHCDQRPGPPSALLPETGSEPVSRATCHTWRPHAFHRLARHDLTWPSERHNQRPWTKMDNVPVTVQCASKEHCFGKLLPESPPQQGEPPDGLGSGTAGTRTLESFSVSALGQEAVWNRSMATSFPPHRPWSPIPRPQSKASLLPLLPLLKDQ